MNKIFSNIYLFLFIGICAASLSFLYSCITQNWDWFSRSGSIVTMTGIILKGKPVFIMGVEKYIESQNIIDCGSILGNTDKEKEANKQLKLDVLGLYIGCFTTILGTLIWGYGDLLSEVSLKLT